MLPCNCVCGARGSKRPTSEGHEHAAASVTNATPDASREGSLCHQRLSAAALPRAARGRDANRRDPAASASCGGECSVPTPEGYGQPCAGPRPSLGSCGGSVRCDGSCSCTCQVHNNNNGFEGATFQVDVYVARACD